jgi:hypothetical protein
MAAVLVNLHHTDDGLFTCDIDVVADKILRYFCHIGDLTFIDY